MGANSVTRAGSPFVRDRTRLGIHYATHQFRDDGRGHPWNRRASLLSFMLAKRGLNRSKPWILEIDGTMCAIVGVGCRGQDQYRL